MQTVGDRTAGSETVSGDALFLRGASKADDPERVHRLSAQLLPELEAVHDFAHYVFAGDRERALRELEVEIVGVGV